MSTTAERHNLRDGTVLLYDPAFIPADDTTALFRELRHDIPWKQESTRGRPFPRLTAWYADPGLTYSYSGVTHHGLPWSTTLQDLRTRVEAVSGTPFNSLLVNLYRDGSDSMGYHADDEPELGPDPVVASISLGGVRTFHLKHRTVDERHSFALASGSLLVMAGTCQRFWLHAVPKTKKTVAPRINLTFRQIITPPAETSE